MGKSEARYGKDGAAGVLSARFVPFGKALRRHGALGLFLSRPASAYPKAKRGKDGRGPVLHDPFPGLFHSFSAGRAVERIDPQLGAAVLAETASPHVCA